MKIRKCSSYIKKDHIAYAYSKKKKIVAILENVSKNSNS